MHSSSTGGYCPGCRIWEDIITCCQCNSPNLINNSLACPICGHGIDPTPDPEEVMRASIPTWTSAGVVNPSHSKFQSGCSTHSKSVEYDQADGWDADVDIFGYEKHEQTKGINNTLPSLEDGPPFAAVGVEAFPDSSETSSGEDGIVSASDTDYDCSTCAGTPLGTETLPGTGIHDFTAVTLSPIDRYIVDRLMNGLHFTFDLKSGVMWCTADGNSPSSGSVNKSTLGGNNSESGSTQSGDKRSRGKRNLQDSGEGGKGSGNKRPKKNQNSADIEIGSSQKLACHYFRHDPQSYGEWHSCTTGYPTVHRIK